GNLGERRNGVVSGALLISSLNADDLGVGVNLVNMLGIANDRAGYAVSAIRRDNQIAGGVVLLHLNVSKGEVAVSGSLNLRSRDRSRADRILYKVTLDSRRSGAVDRNDVILRTGPNGQLNNVVAAIVLGILHVGDIAVASCIAGAGRERRTGQGKRF